MSEHRSAEEERVTVRVDIPVIRTIALLIPCPQCNAGVGDDCWRARDVRWETYVHAARVTPVWVVYRTAYTHGAHDERRVLEKETREPV